LAGDRYRTRVPSISSGLNSTRLVCQCPADLKEIALQWPGQTHEGELQEPCAKKTRRTRYRLGVARRKQVQEDDIISRLADAGEDALRQLVDLPRRTVVGAIDRAQRRLRDAGTRLRAVDPLYGRVVAIERRLDSIEKPKKAPARRASRRAKPSTARRTPTTVAIEPKQGQDNGGRGTNDRDEGAPEQ
jgi:hypothetical protein